MGIKDKVPALERLQRSLDVTPETVFVGDDINDLAVRPVVGLLLAPADACAPLRRGADLCTSPGSRRRAELAEQILQARANGRSSAAGGGVTATTDGPGVFLLGVGARKPAPPGMQLDRRRDADFGFLKEYHVHDALALPAAGFNNRRRPSWLKPRPGGDALSRPTRALLRLLRRSAEATRHSAHRRHPPSYSGLSVDTLRTIRRGFDRYAIPVRPVFLMRDPIERIISSARMQRRKEG